MCELIIKFLTISLISQRKNGFRVSYDRLILEVYFADGRSIKMSEKKNRPCSCIYGKRFI